MKIKFSGIFLGLFAGLVFISQANAQRVELLFDEDQLLKSGRKAVQAGNYDRALFYYEEALKRKDFSHHQRVKLHSDLCVVYMYVDRFDEAITQCEKSLELQSNRWETLNNLGTVYLVIGDYEKAIEFYEKGLKMKSGSEILKSNLELAKQSLAASGKKNSGAGPENGVIPAGV